MPGVEPTIIIGGEVDYLGGNAKLGKGCTLLPKPMKVMDLFKIAPKIAVVTNIENDHMDHYGTMENILKAFKQFLHNLPVEDGLAVSALKMKIFAVSCRNRAASTYPMQSECRRITRPRLFIQTVREPRRLYRGRKHWANCLTCTWPA